MKSFVLSDPINIPLIIFCLKTLEFDEFHNSLKASGLSVGANIVSEFLDDKVRCSVASFVLNYSNTFQYNVLFQCIPYTMRNLRQEKPAWTKKRQTNKTNAIGRGGVRKKTSS